MRAWLNCSAVSDKVEMPDLLGHAVGEQRWELLARLAGNEVRICMADDKLILVLSVKWLYDFHAQF